MNDVKMCNVRGKCTCGGTVQADGVGPMLLREILREWTNAHSGPHHAEASIGWNWEVTDAGTAGTAAAQAPD